LSGRPTQSPSDLAKRLKVWYDGGERGMLRICEMERTPPAVKEAVQRWYKGGHSRLDEILKQLEELDNVTTDK